MLDIKKIIVQEILIKAIALKDKYTKEYQSKATWVCIFSQNDDEYNELLVEAKKLGDIYKETPTGPIFSLNKKIGRTIKILKIRQPDPQKPEKGDADFTVSNYNSLKEECKNKPNFKIISKENFEMIELTEPNSNVRVYFSNPPIEKQYKELFN